MVSLFKAVSTSLPFSSLVTATQFLPLFFFLNIASPSSPVTVKVVCVSSFDILLPKFLVFETSSAFEVGFSPPAVTSDATSGLVVTVGADSVTVLLLVFLSKKSCILESTCSNCFSYLYAVTSLSLDSDFLCSKKVLSYNKLDNSDLPFSSNSKPLAFSNTVFNLPMLVLYAFGLVLSKVLSNSIDFLGSFISISNEFFISLDLEKSPV